MSCEPVISVLMGVFYRRESTALLQRSVESILAQSFADFELLLCDDGSSDAAKTLLEAYAAADKRVRIIRPGNAARLPVKLNACLREACGSFIARMDDDDDSHPERFEKQLAALAEHPDIAFAGCNVNLICEGIPAGTRCLPAYPQIRDFYMTQPYIHPALLFRREALDAIGGYSEDSRQLLCEDYDLLLRLYAKGYRGMNLQEALLDYSIRADGKSGRSMRHRLNEAVTRYERFKELGVLPRALPYVVKPLAVGLIPERLLSLIKDRR